MTGILKRLDGKNPSALRTPEVEGTYYYPPEVGRTFHMYAKPLNPEATLRVVTTSEVQEVNRLEATVSGKDQWVRYEFKTQNSVYSLRVLGLGSNLEEKAPPLVFVNID